MSLVFDWFRNVGGDNSILRRNVNWCANYFSAALDVNTCTSSREEFLSRAKRIVNASSIAYNENGWAYLYDHLDSVPIVSEFFLESCGVNEVVVGYELSRAQKRTLTKMGRAYVDIRLFPLRFLTDYHLSASTNDKSIHDRLVTLTPAPEYIQHHVAFRKSRAARKYDKRLDPKIGAVFFGQTQFDSSRIRNGEFIDDLFIRDALEEYKSEHNLTNFYIKAHPHEPLSRELERELTKIGCKVTRTDTYHLLSVDDIRVCSLSSSVGFEAPHFGAKAKTFLPSAEKFRNVEEQTDVGDYIILPSNIYQKDFFDYILKGDGKFKPYYP
ncbi:MAG: hypothetical protein AAF719_10900, partial [Pseudomonadota bacterium]